jgi:hypothetical protein
VSVGCGAESTPLLRSKLLGHCPERRSRVAELLLVEIRYLSILFLRRRENYLIQQIIKENDSLVKAKLKELAQILDGVENVYFYRTNT